jgi:hypothetical protein
MARKRKSKAGRPPRHQGRPLARSRAFRLLGTLDEQLQAAAAKSKRSVSEEIEYRLSRSFYDDLLTAGFVGDDASADAIRMIRLVMAIVSLQGPWSENPLSAQNVLVATDTIIRNLARLPPDPSKGREWHWGAVLVETLMLARSTMWRAALPPELSSYAEFAEKMLLKLDAERKASETPK